MVDHRKHSERICETPGKESDWTMALKEYYELVGMLRAQLPVLLSFAFMRCLMGYYLSFWIDYFLPNRLKSAWTSVKTFAYRATLVINLLLLGAACYHSTLFWETWNENAKRERPPTELICAEFACTRVQGLACAVALFTMFAKQDPLTLGLSLATLKAVTDGSVYILVTSGFTLAACKRYHFTNPRLFFVLLYTINIFYASKCYTDEDGDGQDTRGRIGGSVLSVSFASLFLMYRVFQYLVHRIKSALSSLYGIALKPIQRFRLKND